MSANLFKAGEWMSSIVKEVLARSVPEIAHQEAPTEYRVGGQSAEDEELERILAGLKTNIKIVGCGGGGSNTVNRLVESGIMGADLYAINTDAQHLLTVHSPHKILIGRRSTKGLGAGALPQIGEEAAREADEEIRAALTGADIVFITCGLGGGTGTGSAPYVASVAKEMGALAIAICTSPFGECGIRPGETPVGGRHSHCNTQRQAHRACSEAIHQRRLQGSR